MMTSPALLTLTLNILEMTCDNCAATVENALKGLPGVQEAHVNLNAETATVTIDATRIAREDLVQVIRDNGYGVRA